MMSSKIEALPDKRKIPHVSFPPLSSEITKPNNNNHLTIQPYPPLTKSLNS